MAIEFDGLFSEDLDIKKSSIIALQSECVELEDKKRLLKILVHLAYESREVIKRTAAKAIAQIIVDIPIVNDFKQLEQFANYLVLESTPACRMAAITIWSTMASQSSSRHTTDFLYDTISNIALDPSVLVREHVYKSLSNFGAITDSYKMYTIEYRPREREYVNTKGDIRRQIPDLANPGLFGVVLQGLEDESVNIRIYSLDCIKQLCINSLNFSTETLYLVIDQLGDAVHAVRIKASEIFLFLMKTYKLTLYSDDIDPISKVIRSPLHDIRQNIISGLKFAKLASLEDLFMLLESLCYIAQLHSSEKESFLKISYLLGINNKQLTPRLMFECRDFRHNYNLKNLKDLIPLAAFFNISEEFCAAYQGEFLFFKSKYPNYLQNVDLMDLQFQNIVQQFNSLPKVHDQFALLNSLQQSLNAGEHNKVYFMFLRHLLNVFLHIAHDDYFQDVFRLLHCFYNYEKDFKSKLSVLSRKRPTKEEIILIILPLEFGLISVQKYEIDMDYVQTTELTPLQYYFCMPNLFEFSVVVPEELGLLHLFCQFEFKEDTKWYVPCSRKMTFAGDVEYLFKIGLNFNKAFAKPVVVKTCLYCTTDTYEMTETLYKPVSALTQLEGNNKFPIMDEIEHFVIANSI